MTWIIALLSIVGYILNIRKDWRCFVVWAITNAYLAILFARSQIWAFAVQFAFFFIMTLLGLAAWRRESRRLAPGVPPPAAEAPALQQINEHHHEMADKTVHVS